MVSVGARLAPRCATSSRLMPASSRLRRSSSWPAAARSRATLCSRRSKTLASTPTSAIRSQHSERSMATQVTLPELGENISSGDLVRLLVHEGDRIEKDQPLLELETDKATIEVPSPSQGTVK